MEKIIIASDSFKGSVSSTEVAIATEKAISKIFPNCNIVKITIADGGEGTVEALTSAMNGQIISCSVLDPLMKTITTQYGILEDGNTAIIEMASASGLTLLSEEERNPMVTTTFGTGELIKDALERGCRKFLVGIGGSATNDAGTGMLQALGFKFLDEKGRELEKGGQILEHIYTIDDSNILPQLKECQFTIACDVDNPFSGENGAACVYAKQKGADPKMIKDLDRGLKKFAGVISKTSGKNIDNIPGAGAAGGLGGGFLAFLNTELKPGIQMILEVLQFKEQIKGADLVITGEGKLDKQTGMGKTAAGVLTAASKQGIPVIALGGAVEDMNFLNSLGFLAVLPILPYPTVLEKAMDKNFTSQNIQNILEQQLRVIRYYKNLKNIL